jgi:hypothetical protein
MIQCQLRGLEILLFELLDRPEGGDAFVQVIDYHHGRLALGLLPAPVLKQPAHHKGKANADGSAEDGNPELHPPGIHSLFIVLHSLNVAF